MTYVCERQVERGVGNKRGACNSHNDVRVSPSVANSNREDLHYDPFNRTAAESRAVLFGFKKKKSYYFDGISEKHLTHRLHTDFENAVSNTPDEHLGV